MCYKDVLEMYFGNVIIIASNTVLMESSIVQCFFHVNKKQRSVRESYARAGRCSCLRREKGGVLRGEDASLRAFDKRI